MVVSVSKTKMVSVSEAKMVSVSEAKMVSVSEVKMVSVSEAKMVSVSKELRKWDQLAPSVLDINDVLSHVTLLMYECL